MLQIQSEAEYQQALTEAVTALRSGELVIFPTETVYGLAALAENETSVETLLEVKKRGKGHPFALAVGSPEIARRYIMPPTHAGEKLLGRCFPGPVTLVFDADESSPAFEALAPAAREAVLGDGTIGIRCPVYDFVLDLLAELDAPLLLTSANYAGEPAPTDSSELDSLLVDEVAVVIDGESTVYQKPSTVVRVGGEGEKDFTVLREGVYPEAYFPSAMATIILFVCTGNICRSPIAELLMRDLAAKRFDCQAGELAENDFYAFSCGVSAMLGVPISENAALAVAEIEPELAELAGRHESRPATDSLLRQADLILVMTESHRRILLDCFPEGADKIALLRLDEQDVADPYAGSIEVYRQTAAEILAALQERFPTAKSITEI